MQVRDAMSSVVLSVGPTHTLRQVARAMSDRKVGAVVVLDPEADGPGILTERDILTFPYFVDKFDPAPVGRPPGRGLTAYVLRTGKPLLATPEEFDDLKKSGEVESIGAPSVDWLGVPLSTGERTWGVIGVQTYDEGVRYTERDRDLLVFVAQHVASAIE